jgi:hypothetical protein
VDVVANGVVDVVSGVVDMVVDVGIIDEGVIREDVLGRRDVLGVTDVNGVVDMTVDVGMIVLCATLVDWITGVPISIPSDQIQPHLRERKGNLKSTH